MVKLDLKTKLIDDYKVEEARVKEVAKGTLSSFLGISVEEVSVSATVPIDTGIRVYLNAGGFDFMYNHPSKKIEFSLDGNLYDVGTSSDVGRIISFQEGKRRFK